MEVQATAADWDRQQAQETFDRYRLRLHDRVIDDFGTWEREIGTWDELRQRQLLSDAAWVQRLGGIPYGPEPYEPELYSETLEELFNGSGDSFDPVIPNYAYRGLKTLVVGQSKAGKSWTTWGLTAAALREGAKVMYLSEEPRGTVADKVRAFRVEEFVGKTLIIIRRQHSQLQKLPWIEVVARLAKDVAARGIDLVVVDTARPWLGLNGEESNSADSIGNAVGQLDPVTEAGAALIILHQAPWTAKRARGSTEFHAVSDLIFYVDGEGKGARTITYVGGRMEDIPRAQTFQWTKGGMQNLGPMRHDKAERLGKVLAVVEAADQPPTADEIADEVDYEADVRTIQRYLVQLIEQGSVSRIKGAPLPDGGREPDRWRRATNRELWAVASGAEAS